MKFVSNDVYIGSFLVIISSIFLAQALRFPGESVYFPSFSLSMLLLFSACLLFWGVVKTVRVRRGTADYTNPEMKKLPFLVLLSGFVYVYIVGKIGFFVSSALYMPCAMLMFRQRKIIPMIATTLVVLGFLYWLFVIQLKVHMPQGILF